MAVDAEGALGLDAKGGVEADGCAEAHLELGRRGAGDVGGVGKEEGGIGRGGIGSMGEEDRRAEEAVGFHEGGDGVRAWRHVRLELEDFGAESQWRRAESLQGRYFGTADVAAHTHQRGLPVRSVS